MTSPERSSYDPYAWVSPLVEIAGMADDDMTAEQMNMAIQFVPYEEAEEFSAVSEELSICMGAAVRHKVAASFRGEASLVGMEQMLSTMNPVQQLSIVAKLAPSQRAGLYELGLQIHGSQQ